MSWKIAAAQAGASLLGGFMQSRSAKKATSAAKDMAAKDRRFQQQMYDQARADAAPFRDASYTALNNLMLLTGQASPASVQSAAAGGVPEVGDGTGLTAVEGAKWNGRPVYRDSQGNIFSGTGRQWAPGDPLEKIGNLDEISEGGKLVFAGKGVRFQGGRALRRSGTDLTRGNGDVISTQPEAPVQAGPAQPQDQQASIDAMVKADPSYQFRMNEGQRALERSAAARGGALSGGALRRQTRYAQDYASTEYTNIYNRIANIAGMGQVYNSNVTQAGLNTAYGMSRNYMDLAASRMSGYAAQGNAWGTALEGVAGAFGDWWGGRASGGNGSWERRTGRVDSSGNPIQGPWPQG